MPSWGMGAPPAQLQCAAGGLGPDGDSNGDGPLLPDPFAPSRELYRALRGAQAENDPLADELLWEGDFMTSQREFIQKKQEEALLERLERRMGERAAVG
jgi:hypothetical protein